MKKTALVLATIFLCMYSRVSAQCTPVSCLPTSQPYGGICDTVLMNGTVNTPFDDFESFHATNDCFSAGLFNPAYSSFSARITSVQGFSYQFLPAGITGNTNAASYTAPALGCIDFSGTPTEAGVFRMRANFTLSANLYFNATCTGGATPLNNAFYYSIYLTVLPDPSFTLPSSTYCVTDAAANLTITGTTGGTFSGPGVSGGQFDPATAGIGTHTIWYVVSAMEGAAIATATDSSSITVTVSSSNTFYADMDNDTYGDAGSTTTGCGTPPAGYVTNDDDCDDNDPTIHPAAIELCDGIDNDCVGGIDNGLTFVTYYLDADSDTYGSADSSISSCAPVAGYVTNNTDCNDTASSIHPGAVDALGNGIDENCDGIDGVLGLESIATLNLSAFPNPASDVVMINGNLNANVQIRVLSLSGAVVMQNNIAFANTHQLNVSGLTQGTYILAITNVDSGKSGYMRLVVAR